MPFCRILGSAKCMVSKDMECPGTNTPADTLNTWGTSLGQCSLLL